ncbi:LysM peptidoglycan-binding domain-containing protein [candidate division KSB1 bacterium]|nr:LysM peptidoglycan-binding domain-containing protein [candidate division KSB1 bacterium]
MNETITKQQLCDRIAKRAGCSKQLAHEIVDELPDIIEKGLYEDGQVRLAGLGTWKLKWMESREGRNPQTGESLIIPAHSKVIFRPEKSLREYINRKYKHLKARELNAGQAEKWDEKEKNRKGWYWIAAASVVIVLLLIVCPGRQENQSLEPSQSIAADKTTQSNNSGVQENVTVAGQKSIKNTTVAMTTPAPEGKTPLANKTTHVVEKGDNLWNLSDKYYDNHFLWPKIYRSNTEKINDPNLIYPGWNLSIPETKSPRNGG